jgi:potassium large conductance calcium-activated channel subfamily M alpha member 1
MSGCDEELITTEAPLDDCLQVRKWWCFLLSSIFTFLAGLLIVLLWRAFAFICCRKEPELSPNDPKQKEQKANRGKQEFEGTFMTEAKDWAGELISGQTTTGRILVSNFFIPERNVIDFDGQPILQLSNGSQRKRLASLVLKIISG